MIGTWRVAVSLMVLYHAVRVIESVIRCSACQGIAGDDCDVSPWSTAHSVPCAGKCITRRTLYANGRNLRTIWRGCEDTLFPGILSEEYKDSCGYGNFFVECTRTCSGAMCNKNHTGIPRCWSCLGDYQSCDEEPPTQCADVTITTTPRVVTRLECVACTGRKGEICDTRPYRATDIVECDSSCVTRRTLHASNRSLIAVWRGCKETLFPSILHPAALDSCDQADYSFVECTSTCSQSRCNKYSTGFTDCWTEEGRRKPTCEIEDETDGDSDGFQADLLDDVSVDQRVQTNSTNDLPEGTVINCTLCQGVAGEPCDVTPHEIRHTVPCNGACITRRTLFANGRALRSIWRGCDTTLFPGILDERFRNTCQYGNFFVECTDTCRTADRCNQNVTGVPQCWSCLGDSRSCDIAKEERCDQRIEVTTSRPRRPPRLIQCLSCTSRGGAACDVASYTIDDRVPCNSSCVAKKLLDSESRDVVTVWRGCEDTLAYAPGLLNNCIETADSEHITCTSGCYDTACNKYLTGFGECWTEEGTMKAECMNRETTTQHNTLRSPSRVSTKKPYSIQDAYGGDNYRGEWRPTAGTVTEGALNTSTNSTTYNWRSYKKWDLPSYGEFNRESRLSVSTALVTVSSVTLLTLCRT